MEEIRARAEKHIEVEEDQADRLEAERQPRAGDTSWLLRQKTSTRPNRRTTPLMLTPLREKRTPLHKKKTQILREIYHTNLLKYLKDAKGRRLGANTQEWCKFHKAYDHSTEDCRTLQEQIERLVHEGYLSQYIQRGSEKTPTSPRASNKAERGEAPKEAREGPRREEKRGERSRGGDGIGAERSRKRKASDVLVVREKVDMTPTLVITFKERDMQYDPPRHD
ncbi:hypothetical protein CR513_49247, partial [Mucuna pruriens]